MTHWKRPWCKERLKAGGEGVDRGWDGWMASPTPRTWVWASSGSWWWTGKPGVLQSMGSQRVRHDWVTKLTETCEDYFNDLKRHSTILCVCVPLCLILCDPVGCSFQGSSVHGISQARILEYVAVSYSGGSFQPGDQTWVSCILGGFFTVWATRKV